jgi:microcystin-dependent protein
MEGCFGEIKLFGGSFPPRGWTFCTGYLMPINQNAALYSILGTIYGGNGTSNFALPDLRYSDEHGNKYIGYEQGKPSYIICISGTYPSRD